MTITLIILSIVFAILSGISKAIMDLSEEGKLKGNPIFWHKSKSWQNKWKNGDKMLGEKFWLSSTFFVAQTDAWHLFGTIMFYSYWISFTISGFIIGYNFTNKYYLFLLLIPYLSRATFHIFYTYKILRK
jgi:hypothetical protein